jgi:ABC-type transport system substrate-binding protein
VLYTLDFPQTLVYARIVRRNLAKIGLDVEVKGLPQAAFFSRAFARGEPVDIVFTPWTPDYIDVRLARDAAPMVATTFLNEPTLVSERVGCIVLRPELDLTAVCLK